MSSLSNAHKSAGRTYRERPQPPGRRHLGELEKRKDYKKRATAYSKHQENIRKLRIHALDKNPDEFHFHMVNSRIEDGRHYEVPKESKNTEQQEMLMQSQNEKYVMNKLQVQRNKIERLLTEFGTLFANCQNDKRAKRRIKRRKGSTRVDVEISDSDIELLSKKFPCQLSKATFLDAVANLHPQRRSLFKELIKRVKLENELKIVADKIRTQRLVNNSKRQGEHFTKVRDGDFTAADLYEWNYNRKR